VDTSELYARGLRRRKKMFGEPMSRSEWRRPGIRVPLQNVINAYVYGDIWETARPLQQYP